MEGSPLHWRSAERVPPTKALFVRDAPPSFARSSGRPVGERLGSLNDPGHFFGIELLALDRYFLSVVTVLVVPNSVGTGRGTHPLWLHEHLRWVCRKIWVVPKVLAYVPISSEIWFGVGIKQSLLLFSRLPC